MVSIWKQEKNLVLKYHLTNCLHQFTDTQQERYMVTRVWIKIWVFQLSLNKSVKSYQTQNTNLMPKKQIKIKKIKLIISQILSNSINKKKNNTNYKHPFFIQLLSDKIRKMHSLLLFNLILETMSEIGGIYVLDHIFFWRVYLSKSEHPYLQKTCLKCFWLCNYIHNESHIYSLRHVFLNRKQPV